MRADSPALRTTRSNDSRCQNGPDRPKAWLARCAVYPLMAPVARAKGTAKVHRTWTWLGITAKAWNFVQAELALPVFERGDHHCRDLRLPQPASAVLDSVVGAVSPGEERPAVQSRARGWREGRSVQAPGDEQRPAGRVPVRQVAAVKPTWQCRAIRTPRARRANVGYASGLRAVALRAAGLGARAASPAMLAAVACSAPWNRLQPVCHGL